MTDYEELSPFGAGLFTPSTKSPILRLALMRTSSIGDVVLASACLSLLRQLRLRVEATWVGSEPSLDFIRQAYPDVRCIEVKRGQSLAGSDLVDQLASVHFFVDLQTNLRSHMLTLQLQKKSGIEVFAAQKMYVQRNRSLLAARLKGRRQVLTDEDRSPQKYQYQLAVDALVRGLRACVPVEYLDGMRPEEAYPSLPLPSEAEHPWRKELRFGKWIAVAPGAAHPTKRAPVEVFCKTLQEVHRRTHVDGSDGEMGLLMLGGPDDREVASKILASLDWAGPSMNLAGRLSLWESALALSEVSRLLTNDSALSHVAEAVGTSVAVLFGPTIESFGFAPCRPDSRAFSSTIGCRPCSKHGKVPCRFKDQACFQSLPLDEVAGFLCHGQQSTDMESAPQSPAATTAMDTRLT